MEGILVPLHRFCDASSSMYMGRSDTMDDYQLLLTNSHDVLHHSKRAANKGGCSL